MNRRTRSMERMGTSRSRQFTFLVQWQHLPAAHADRSSSGSGAKPNRNPGGMI